MWSERSAVSLRFKMQSDVVEGPFCVPFCPGADSPRAFCLTYDHVWLLTVTRWSGADWPTPRRTFSKRPSQPSCPTAATATTPLPSLPNNFYIENPPNYPSPMNWYQNSGAIRNDSAVVSVWFFGNSDRFGVNAVETPFFNAPLILTPFNCKKGKCVVCFSPSFVLQ